MKLVINDCHGGFGLSEKAVLRYAGLKGLILDVNRGAWYTYYRLGEEYWNEQLIPRNDPMLVQAVEELGELANGDCAKLKVVEVPPGTKYRITEYHGLEDIETVDNIYWSVAC
jgi:hypothetical protein